MIYQTFQEATRARKARKVKIVDLGLQPWEAIDLGLEVEDLEEKDRRKPVADYVLDRGDAAPDGAAWEEWLQTHRVELNAMTTPQLIEWLDGKMAAYDKLIPPPDVLEAELETRIEGKVRDAIAARILEEAGFEDQVAAAIATIKKPSAAALKKDIKALFKRKLDCEWRDHIEAVTNAVFDGAAR
jgi:hypothetical protein